MEACAGAHYMARKLATSGHEVKLISPQFVRPFVKSNKNDFVDAEAICEAATRPAMRFVTPKTESQQTLSALHRARESLVHDRVKIINQIYGFLLEFGISLPVGLAVIRRLPAVLAEQALRLCQVGGRRLPVKLKSSYPNQITFSTAPVTVQSCHVAKRSLSTPR
jgi:transposase